MKELPVVSLNGLHAGSLGFYLASLGLLSLTARRWPKTRACWRNTRFCLVGGPNALNELVEFVDRIGETKAWTQYEKPWDEEKKVDVKKRTSTRTAHWRALEADERSLPAFGAHLALDDRVRMNPLLGTGGNAGKRDFAKGWKAAVKFISEPKGRLCRDDLINELSAFLSGQRCIHLASYQAGSWFGMDNKIYNSGNKRPYCQGKITPWAMTLACEGLVYLSGGSSRRLGSRRQPKGAFPFVTSPIAPTSANEAGRIDAEFWAPIWDQPMTEPEVRSLFLRGRVESDARGGASPAVFAVGITNRGVDAGVSEFRRFLLLHTTSPHTFESQLATIIPVPKTNFDSATNRAVRSIVEFHDTLESDRKVGKRWKVAGLRQPIEQALVDFSAAQRGEDSTDPAWKLVDEMLGALVRVDRNRTFRSGRVRFRLLPGEWAVRLLREDQLERETRIALAISSLEETGVSAKLIAYRIGVQKSPNGLQWEFPESPPARRVWSDAELAENLRSTAERRVMETLRQSDSRPPFRAAFRVGLDDLHAWLAGEVDEERVRLWLDRLCMFDWSETQHCEVARGLRWTTSVPRPAVDGALALYALFRPLASDWLFRRILRESEIATESTSTCAHLGRVVAMLRHGNVTAATEVAIAAYRAAGLETADFGPMPEGPDFDQLLASLVIPVRDEQVLSVFRRWRNPKQV